MYWLWMEGAEMSKRDELIGVIYEIGQYWDRGDTTADQWVDRILDVLELEIVVTEDVRPNRRSVQ